MSKAKIAVIGAGLMGHGIAQVFALAGHEVTVGDTVMKNLDTLATRIAANLPGTSSSSKPSSADAATGKTESK